MKRIFVLLGLVFVLGGISAEPAVFGGSDTLAPFGPLMKKILAEAGIRGSVVFEPQARLVFEAENGALDGYFFLTSRAVEEIPTLTKVPVPLYKNELVAVAVRQDIHITTTEDLSQYSVGIERGNRTHEALARHVGTLFYADNQVQQFRMLAIGRFDVALSARALVASLARQAGMKVWYVQEPPLLSQQMYLCLAPRGMGYMVRLTDALRRAVDSGQWARDVGEVLERNFK